MDANDRVFTANQSEIENKNVPIEAFGKIGYPVHGWKRRPYPSRTPTEGRTCLEPLSVESHARDLFDAFGSDAGGRTWNHILEGPFPDFSSFRTWLESIANSEDRLDFAIIDGRTHRAVGTYGYLHVDPENGTVEIGNPKFSPAMQRTTTGTEAGYLMLRRIFDESGYRRCVARCSALNSKSSAAVARIGFRREGVSRQVGVYKGLLNIDVMYFSLLDSEWPKVRTAFEKWLDPENFDETGNQIQSLSKFMLSDKI